MSGYKGLGVFKKHVDEKLTDQEIIDLGFIKSAKLENDLTPKLGGHLDGNQKNVTNIPWLQTMNIGANEVLIGQGDMSAADYGYSGLSFQHPLGGYFNIGTGDDAGTKYLFLNTPNDGVSYFLYQRNHHLEKSIVEIDGSDDKHLVSKEWVLSKIPTAGITKLLDDLTPKLGGNLDLNGKNITTEAVQLNVEIDTLNSGVGLMYFKSTGEVILRLSNTGIRVYKSIEPDPVDSIDIGANTKRFKDLYLSGSLYAKDANFTDGATGSFTSNDGKTITVTNGIITGIV